MVNNYYYNVIVVLKHRLSNRKLGNFCRLLPEEQILARRKSHENRNSQSIISNQSIRNRSSFPQAIGIRGKTPQSRFLPSRGSQRSSMLFRCQIPYRIWTLKKTSPFLLVLLDSQPSECYQVCGEDKISLLHRVRGVRIVWHEASADTFDHASINSGQKGVENLGTCLDRFYLCRNKTHPEITRYVENRFPSKINHLFCRNRL